MSQRRAVQRRPNLWISGADQERTGPAAVPADPDDRTIRALYKGRTAVERINARLKLYWGADDGNVVGARRLHAMVGVVMLVHLALGTALAGKGEDDQDTEWDPPEPDRAALNEQIEHDDRPRRTMSDHDNV